MKRIDPSSTTGALNLQAAARGERPYVHPPPSTEVPRSWREQLEQEVGVYIYIRIYPHEYPHVTYPLSMEAPRSWREHSEQEVGVYIDVYIYIYVYIHTYVYMYKYLHLYVQIHTRTTHSALQTTITHMCHSDI